MHFDESPSKEEQDGRLLNMRRQGHSDQEGNPLFLNPPESQEGETESQYMARTQLKHQQNQDYMMKIRQVGYNKRKMLWASNLPSDFEFPSQEDEEHIDVSQLEPLRSNRHVFVSHLIRIHQVQNGTIESFGDGDIQR